MSSKELSIVIPAYNEEKRLRTTIVEIEKKCREVFVDKFEIIIVNDGSRDNTQKVIDDMVSGYSNIRSLEYKKNKGKGYAVKCGVLESEGEYVMYLDADGATNVEDIFNIIEARTTADIIIASRSVRHAQIVIEQPFWRKKLGARSIKFAKSIDKLPIKDTQCGCKLFRRSAAIDLFRDLFTQRWLFDIELLRKAYAKKYSIKEWPVRWSNISGSKVTLWGYCTSLYELFWIMIRTYR